MPDSIQKQLLDETRTLIAAMGLSNLPTDEIKVRRQPYNTQGLYRGITIHPVPEREAWGTNERDDIGYGIGITMCRGGDHAAYELIDEVPAWREKIRRELAYRTITISASGCDMLTTHVEHGQLLVPKEFAHWEFSHLVLRCWVRESRT